MNPKRGKKGLHLPEDATNVGKRAILQETVHLPLNVTHLLFSDQVKAKAITR